MLSALRIRFTMAKLSGCTGLCIRAFDLAELPVRSTRKLFICVMDSLVCRVKGSQTWCVQFGVQNQCSALRTNLTKAKFFEGSSQVEIPK